MPLSSSALFVPFPLAEREDDDFESAPEAVSGAVFLDVVVTASAVETSVDVVLEGSVDGENWVALATVDQLTDAGTARETVGPQAIPDWVRATAAVVGAATFSVVVTAADGAGDNDAAIVANEQATSAVAADVAVHETRLDTAEADIAALQSAVSDAETAIDTNTDDIADLVAALADLDARVVTLEEAP